MAKKTFDHAVIYDGKFYPPKTPIEFKEDKKPEDKKAVTKNDRGAGKKS
jgi:hypothetical protein